MTKPEIQKAVAQLRAYIRLMESETNTFKQQFLPAKIAEVQASIAALEAMYETN